jgi:hypothetical protein
LDDVEVASAWTPNPNVPSFSATMEEFAWRSKYVCIDGINQHTGDRAVFLKCPGSVFHALTFKVMMGIATRAVVSGIQVEDVAGMTYLISRDGTLYIEPKKAG